MSAEIIVLEGDLNKMFLCKRHLFFRCSLVHMKKHIVRKNQSYVLSLINYLPVKISYVTYSCPISFKITPILKLKYYTTLVQELCRVFF